MEYVWFDYENNSPDAKSSSNMGKNQNEFSSSNGILSGRKKRSRLSDMGQEILEGYIMTAGLDQRIFLWTIYGKCVGEFGTFGWDINNESTWNLRKYNPYDASAIQGSNILHAAHENKKRNQANKFGNTVSSVLHNLQSLMEEFPGITNPHDLLILKKYKPKKTETANKPANQGPVTLSLHPKKKKDDFSARNITKDSLIMKDSSSHDLLANYYSIIPLLIYKK